MASLGSARHGEPAGRGGGLFGVAGDVRGPRWVGCNNLKKLSAGPKKVAKILIWAKLLFFATMSFRKKSILSFLGDFGDIIIEEQKKKDFLWIFVFFMDFCVSWCF